MQKVLNKIAVVGPESTGKTVLCEQLAKHYQSTFVPEFARDFLLERNNVYTQEDLLFIVEQQAILEKKIEQEANRFLFIDNDYINLKIWMQEVFQQNNAYIHQMIITHTYQLYLLCDIDVAWEADILRQNENNRDYLYQRFEEELNHYQFPYVKISGIGETRLQQAIEKIDLHFT
ncbi:MAG: ATP-binding protein [Bacteroidota bacterium]